MREVRGAPRLHTHGMQFGHLFGQGQQQRHGAKRHAFVVEVEARHNDAVALVGQFVADLWKSFVEELGLVHRHDGKPFAPTWLASPCVLDVVPKRLAAVHDNGAHGVFVVAHDFDVVVPRVRRGLEQRHGQLGDVGPADASEQLFCFARKHGATNDFQASFPCGKALGRRKLVGGVHGLQGSAWAGVCLGP